MKIEDTLRHVETQRGYAQAYETAERSDKLDGRNFADLDEQRRWFAERRAAAYRALAGELTTLSALVSEQISREKDQIKIAAHREEISILKSEIATAWKNGKVTLAEK